VSTSADVARFVFELYGARTVLAESWKWGEGMTGVAQMLSFVELVSFVYVQALTHYQPLKEEVNGNKCTYGMGTQDLSTAGTRLHGHTGAAHGFCSHSAYCPEHNFALSIASNMMFNRGPHKESIDESTEYKESIDEIVQAVYAEVLHCHELAAAARRAAGDGAEHQ
jgi:hypothetical protein